MTMTVISRLYIDQVQNVGFQSSFSKKSTIKTI